MCGIVYKSGDDHNQLIAMGCGGDASTPTTFPQRKKVELDPNGIKETREENTGEEFIKAYLGKVENLWEGYFRHGLYFNKNFFDDDNYAPKQWLERYMSNLKALLEKEDSTEAYDDVIRHSRNQEILLNRVLMDAELPKNQASYTEVVVASRWDSVNYLIGNDAEATCTLLDAYCHRNESHPMCDNRVVYLTGNRDMNRDFKPYTCPRKQNISCDNLFCK